MKFDFAIGNPPYQEESNLKTALSDDSKRNFAPPVYNLFMDAAFQIADVVEMIHPARFLFNAGSTPKAWNEKMLNDEYFEIIHYEANSEKIFPSLSTPIKGGIAISYRNANIKCGSIKAFSPYPELNKILQKVLKHNEYVSLSNIIYPRTAYRFTKKLHIDHPWAIKKLSDGHAYDVSSNIFSLLPEIFHDSLKSTKNYTKILGRYKNNRVYKYIKSDYLNKVENLHFYKVVIPQATGNGLFGEPISLPSIEEPNTASTETFISIGKFNSLYEANSLRKYICTKFLRALLGVLKVTQNGNKPVWKFIPLQDFSTLSDINWSLNIKSIDKQLYHKYNLSEKEVSFIENTVKEMMFNE